MMSMGRKEKIQAVGNNSKFLLIILWISSTFILGLSVFTNGFLLTRTEISKHSPLQRHFADPTRAYTNTSSRANALDLWEYSKWQSFPKVVLIVIDGLRFDFIQNNRKEDNFYLNKMKFLQSLLESQRERTRLFKFIADPPTTTMQRLKGLTTGSLPTFIDAGSNFASSEIEEDSLIFQLHLHGKRMIFMGDETWLNLYPRYFERKFPFPSFDVKDLDTVDNGIIDHLIPEMKKNDWNLIVAHFLGVDHCGHRYGPNHPEMARKLTQMDSFLKDVIRNLDNDTITYIFGDHGMTQTGDHGGDSADEVTAALFVHSKRRIFSSPEQNNLNSKAVSQVDIVPTLALQLNISIPFSNIGSIIEDLFSTSDDGIEILDSDENSGILQRVQSNMSLIIALHQNVLQVYRYLKEFSKLSSDISQENIASLEKTFLSAEQQVFALLDSFKEIRKRKITNDGNVSKSSLLSEMFENQVQLRMFLRNVFNAYQEIWAKFNMAMMAAGVFMMLMASLVSLCGTIQLSKAETNEALYILDALCLRDFIGILCNFFSWIIVLQTHFRLVILASLLQIISLSFLLFRLGSLFPIKRHYKNIKFSDCISIFAVIAYTTCLFSNSFIIRENWFLLSSIQTLLLFHFLSSVQKMLNSDQYVRPTLFNKKGITKKKKQMQEDVSFPIWTLVLSICVRISMAFWSCREENKCEENTLLRRLDSLLFTKIDTYFRLRIFLAVTSILVVLISTYVWCKRNGSLLGTSVVALSVKVFQPIIGISILLHWILQIPVRSKLASVFGLSWIQQVLLPRVSYSLSLLTLGMLLWNPLSIYLIFRDKTLPRRRGLLGEDTFDLNVKAVFKDLRESLNCKRGSLDDRTQTCLPPLVYGLKNVYIATFVSLMAPVMLCTILLLGDGLAFSVVLMATSSLCLLLTSRNSYSTGSGTYTIVMWMLMNSYWFFATGHQMTIPSIRFDSAFVGLEGNSQNRFLPALLILLNTFSSTVFYSLSLPLIYLCNAVLPDAKSHAQVNATDADESGEICLQQDSWYLQAFVAKTVLGYLSVSMYKVTMMSLVAMVHRRHLMVWKIFGPRFVFEAASFIFSFPFLLLGYLLFCRIQNALRKWTMNLEHICKLDEDVPNYVPNDVPNYVPNDVVNYVPNNVPNYASSTL